MHTVHTVYYEDSRAMDKIADASIDLVVTSPPYPMIEMWDGLFAELDPEIGRLLAQGDSMGAFEAMHRVLDAVWLELFRVMKEGAFACINIGDATRTIGGRFQLFANHARLQNKFFDLGFDILPSIIWRKQTNAPNKFMGSGMLPAGAYVTLEHELILIFRKGSKRTFNTAAGKQRRMQSGYFWEERNVWFSDLWDFKGVRQDLEPAGKELRARSAAFPFLLPFRLINMYSLLGDTVLDPFLGTGTTMLAAIASGRNSIGYERDRGFAQPLKERIAREYSRLNSYNRQRLEDHVNFVAVYTAEKGRLKYTNRHYSFPVMTRQEQNLQLPFVESVSETAPGIFTAVYCEPPEAGSLVEAGFKRVNGGAGRQQLLF
jgi:DNA modification methylase